MDVVWAYFGTSLEGETRYKRYGLGTRPKEFKLTFPPLKCASVLLCQQNFSETKPLKSHSSQEYSSAVEKFGITSEHFVTQLQRVSDCFLNLRCMEHEAQLCRDLDEGSPMG